MDDDHPADPVGRITIHAFPHFGTGDIDIESPCVKGGSHVLYPFDPFLNIFNDLIITDNEDDLSRTKIDGINTVPDPINIDQFSIQSDGIDAAQEEIGCHLRLPYLKDILF